MSTALPRFLTYVLDHVDGCHLWAGPRDAGGYGLFSPGDGTPTANAHRWYYQRVNGPIPEGMVLDHLCRRRWCVNPAHLEVVTQAENMARGLKGRLKPLICKRGHDQSEANTYPYGKDGKVYRACRLCRTELRVARQTREDVAS